MFFFFVFLLSHPFSLSFEFSVASIILSDFHLHPFSLTRIASFSLTRIHTFSAAPIFSRIHFPSHPLSHTHNIYFSLRFPLFPTLHHHIHHFHHLFIAYITSFLTVFSSFTPLSAITLRFPISHHRSRNGNGKGVRGKEEKMC